MKLPTIRMPSLPSLPAGTSEYFQKNFLTILAIVFIVIIVLGYLFFYSTFVAPALDTRNKLAIQVTEARQLAQSRGILPSSPDSLQLQLNGARAAFNTASKALLTEAQISDYIKRLYLYADESRVKIIDLQTSARAGVQPSVPTPTATRPITPTAIPVVPPTPVPAQTGQPTVLLSPTATRAPATATITPTRTTQAAPTAVGANLFRVTSVRLQVRGTSNQLIEFVSRIREATIPGVVINELRLDEGEKNALLSMELMMVSNAAPETATPRPTAAPATKPPVVPTSAPLPPPMTIPPPPPKSDPTFMPTFPPPPTPMPMATATATLSPSSTTYVVRAGDTLFSIAKRYGVTVEAIMAANRMPNFNIYIGQTLIIPR